jgi:phosphoglycerol transferase MdoB-like AlkP superfamily enzyme
MSLQNLDLESRAPSSLVRSVTRFMPAALLAGFSLAVWFITRVVLILVHGGWPIARWPTIAHALAVGEVYDVTIALWLMLPLVMYLTLASERWLRRTVNRVLFHATVTAASAGLLFVAVAEVLFFSEFDGRFNFVALDYLIYPTEVVTNIWESYPTAWILVGIAALSAAIALIVRRPVRRAIEAPAAFKFRLGIGVTYATILATFVLVVSPTLAHVSDDRALNEIASNGFYSIWGAFEGQSTSYDALYATRDRGVLLPRIRGLLSDPATPVASFAPRSTMRHVAATRPSRPLNVVVVLEESLGSQFIGALHPNDSGPSLTPSFDSLATEGTLLTHAYSTGNRTIRALEATTSSIPPLPGISIVRRPESVNLFTLPALLRSRGYATEFVYGGRAIFDGMGTYLRHNGMDRVVDQSDYAPGQFTTAWGVADEAIFDKALSEMDARYAEGRPFYTLVLSVSNHRPYTYPAGRIAANPDERKRVNAVRYADWALGRFMREARTHEFFDKTVFVLMGDHGPRVYGAAEIPLPSYSVPVLLYGPGIIASGVRINEIASSMDVPPTVLGLLGGGYDSKFFGRDVLSATRRSGLAVMTHNNEVALMRGTRLAVLGLRGASTVYDVLPDGSLRAVVRQDASARALVEDAIAYFQTADELYRDGQYRFEVPSRVVASASGSR